MKWIGQSIVDFIARFRSDVYLDSPSIFRFDDFYGLYITVGASDTVDVIISN